MCGRIAEQVGVARLSNPSPLAQHHGPCKRREKLGVMRGAVELLEQPYAFVVRRPLTAAEFVAAARLRGLHMNDATLRRLFERGLLVPLLGLAGESPRRGVTRDALLRARIDGRLHDPAQAPGACPPGSTLIYSAHQLTTAGTLLRLGGTLGDVPEVVREALDVQRENAIALTIAEQVHHSRIVGFLRLPAIEDYEPHYRWRDQLSPTALVDWLGVDPQWLRARARRLLADAHATHTLGAFSQLVGRGDAKAWEQLRDEPRRNIDLRVAGEILVREAERADGQPHALEDAAAHQRLQRRVPLDELLQDVGLSPHPRLVLIVEGKTELILVPRVYEQLGGRLADDFIRLVDAEGIDRDLELLAGFLAPKLSQARRQGTVDFERPPTQILFVGDRERRMTTAADREHVRKQLVGRMLRALPGDLQVPHVREQISELVHVVTWKRGGSSFEFAHFTDLQIARAIDRVDHRAGKPTVAALVPRVSSVRRSRGSLKKAFLEGVAGKGLLAEALWPDLERKIASALRAGTAHRIPVVRVLHEADRLAAQFIGGTWVLSLPAAP